MSGRDGLDGARRIDDARRSAFRKLDLPPGDPRDVEQVVDEPGQVLDLAG